MELRCPSKLQGIVVSEGIVEVACTSRYCGAGRGVVIRHRFNIQTGELVETLRFQDPSTHRKAGG